MPKITHVIFDMDGLLLDTELIYTEATNLILQKFNLKFNWEIKSQMMGCNQKDAAEKLISYYNIPDFSADQYLKERNELHYKLFPSCKPLPGVKRLVSHFKKLGIPMAVATSSHNDAFLLKTKHNQDLFSMFDVVLCGDDPRVARGKPAPDQFILASELINSPNPKSCLVFEDAPSGVEAAINAGMNVIWIPDENLALDQHLSSKCSKVLKSMLDFNPEEFGIENFCD